MKKGLITICVFFTTIIFSQSEINWDGNYKLQLSDFKSSSTQIGNVEVNNIMMPLGMEFAFMMSNVEFMFTKNFNSRVNNVFKRDAASIIAIDKANAQNLVEFAQFGFDLTELYARKLRKKIFEEKKTLSNVAFLKPLYDELQNELSARFANASKDTELGKSKDKLKVLHEQALMEIENLSEFCKDCKPIKKK